MTLESKMKRMFSSIIILVGLMVAFSTHAWMDDCAPAFNCTPAEAEELSEANVSNFVSCYLTAGCHIEKGTSQCVLGFGDAILPFCRPAR